MRRSLRNKSTHKRIYIKAIFFALIISILSILRDNFPSNIFDNLELYTHITHWFVPNDTEQNDVYFLDVSNDKEIVDYYLNNSYKGSVPIAKRSLLIDFLKEVENYNYKCIFIDLFFEKGKNTPQDSILIQQIKKMKNVFVAKPSKDNPHIIPDSTFIPFGAHVDYNSSYTSTNFTRDIFMFHDEPSAGLLIDCMINSSESYPVSLFTLFKKSRKPLGFYTRNGKLFRNCPIITVPRNNLTSNVQLSFFVKYDDKEWKRQCIDNKIVIIGDFNNDQHSTYTCDYSGSALIYCSYKQLEKEKAVNWFVIYFLMFLLYLAIILNIIKRHYLISLFARRNRITIFHNRRLLGKVFYRLRKIYIICAYNYRKSYIHRFVKYCKIILGTILSSLIWYTVLLSIISILFFYKYNIIINTFIPTFCFSIISTFHNISDRLKHALL